MPDLLAARAQMGTSLAFHIIFSALGVGLPLLLCIAEGLALFRKDKTWMMLARRWTRAAAILFALCLLVDFVDKSAFFQFPYNAIVNNIFDS